MAVSQKTTKTDPNTDPPNIESHTDPDSDPNTDPDTDLNADPDPNTDLTNEDLQQVLVEFFRKKKKDKKTSKAKASLQSRLTAYQRCLQLVLKYQVYQVKMHVEHGSVPLSHLQVAEDMNSGQKQTKCFKFLVGDIMRQLQPGLVDQL